MQQLPLEVGPADHAVFANFYPGPNAGLLHALQDLAVCSPRGLLWLWGPSQSGRSHLLQATVAAADEAGQRAIYLPLNATLGMGAAALDGLAAVDLVALDDIESVAGDPAWETALFELYEQLRPRRAGLVLSSNRAPLHADFSLPDLTSRFTSGATFRLKALSDDEKIAALRHRATWRGLQLPRETAVYLLSRVDRQTGRLFELLDTLDRQSLVAQKRLTVPFVKGVLAKQKRPGDSAG